MSLLSRKRAVAAAAGVASASVGATAGAADIWYQPVVTLSTAYNTNVDLDEGAAKRSAVGYFADLATNIDFSTRTSDNIFQPRLLYNYYPTATDRDRLEGFLNTFSSWRWQRDRFTLQGYFQHQDDVNAEQPTAVSNPVNPGIGENSPTTGQAAVGTTQNYLILDPTYSHQLTPLSSVGVSGEYQGIRYSPVDSGHVDFNYFAGRLFYAKAIDLRTDFSLGVSGSNYKAGAINSEANTGGISGGMGYNWTQTLRTDVTAQWEHAKFTEVNPNKNFETSANPWAATISTVYKEQVSDYRISVGRTIYPSSNGTLYTINQARAQYDRQFSQRLNFTGAIRFFRDETTLGGSGDDRRNYLTGTLRVQYMVTPLLFVAGSYTYVYQKYLVQPDSADVNVAMISFGYRGLPKPQ